MSRTKCIYGLLMYLDIFIAREDSKPLNVKSVKLDGKPAELRAFDLNYDKAESTLNIDGDIFRVDWDNRTGEFDIDRKTGIMTTYFEIDGRHIAITSDYAEALYYYYNTDAIVRSFLDVTEDKGIEFTEYMRSISEYIDLLAYCTEYRDPDIVVKCEKDKLIKMYRYCISKINSLCDGELVDL